MSTRSSSEPHGNSLKRGLRAPLRGQTYRNLCYLVVMFPLGIFYFTLLTAGFALGLPLVVVLVGIPILVSFLVLAVGLAGFERRLVRVLLGIEIPMTDATDGGFWTRLKRLVSDYQTWKAVAYLLSEYIYGSVAFGLLGSVAATAGSFLLAPLYYTDAPVVAYGPPPGEFTLDLLFGWDSLLVGLTTTFRLGSWQVETLGGALLAALGGLVLSFVLLQLGNALAWVWGRYARIMLRTPRYWSPFIGD